ncbi:MAG TPA: S-layer homology domain-containing protein [Candidatus Enterocloster faecavium]|uniref:S-layer homology domain-containing protein n=1 Tax=Candidatus Enterocloster faecavium TaxID=2838560 RepID=A0A9D2L8I4_9FIRM|nr:S-layer homology domain-containing protein [Candidatus Enterocloster faecavium]
MRRGYRSRRCMYTVLSAAVGSTALAPYCVYANTSAANFQMREQVVDLVGIMSITDSTAKVSRADFAEMLVKASSWRENLTSTAVSVFADVPATHPSAIYIRIAASQGWMTGYLGGMFKPDDYITYKDAVKAVLALLGYTDDDFTGDLASSRISKFNYLELNEQVTNRQADEVLTQTDCMNIFYNLLKATPKDSSTIYGSILDCELNNDGEINPITILDDERRGPILVRKGFSVADSVPFSTTDANVFLNGVASDLAAVTRSQRDCGFAVIYYNVKSKTIWAYTTSGWDDEEPGNGSYILLKGEVKSIYYQSTDVITPTAIELEVDLNDSSDSELIDSDGTITVGLDSSELQYVFSIYGSIQVGDEVVVVCQGSGTSYSAVDVLEY